MKKSHIIYRSILLLAGLILISLSIAGLVSEFWSGMGSALAVVGGARLLQIYRLRKSEAYREKMEVMYTDERNQFIRNKAWTWAGYLFFILCGICVIVFKIIGQDLLSTVASYAICLMLVLYWISFLVLRKKY